MVDAPMLLRQVREDDDVDKGGKDMDASKDQPKEDMADAEYDVEHEVEQGVGINDDHIQRPKASHLWKALPNTKTSMGNFRPSQLKWTFWKTRRMAPAICSPAFELSSCCFAAVVMCIKMFSYGALHGC
ncbi:hypothetical protein RHMOL_Rhmol13G0200700 [Rhododendron molle]|uniref:Uncharacterized protein n=1 Tax=Rhododendron molle TaxID=49168 RepID=A0ACC0L9P4_RHOML|nr:hypothetical protein RHMOL_Rhmol13G0200700 [Rhododendron molle]